MSKIHHCVNRLILNWIINNLIIRLDLFKWKAYSCFLCLSLGNTLIIGYSFSIKACVLRYTEIGQTYVKTIVGDNWKGKISNVHVYL